MRLAISKRTVCPNDSSKTLGEGPKEILIIIVTTAEEAAEGIKDTRDKVRQTSPNKKGMKLITRTIQTPGT